jgi:hypothetical protein
VPGGSFHEEARINATRIRMGQIETTSDMVTTNELTPAVDRSEP